jgi:hypothetical protein
MRTKDKKRVDFYLTPEEHEILEAHCDKTGKTKTEVLREYVRSLAPKENESMQLEELMEELMMSKGIRQLEFKHIGKEDFCECYVDGRFYGTGRKLELLQSLKATQTVESDGVSLEQLLHAIQGIKSYELVSVGLNVYNCYIDDRWFARGTREELATTVRRYLQQPWRSKVKVYGSMPEPEVMREDEVAEELPEGWEETKLGWSTMKGKFCFIEVVPDFDGYWIYVNSELVHSVSAENKFDAITQAQSFIDSQL